MKQQQQQQASKVQKAFFVVFSRLQFWFTENLQKDVRKSIMAKKDKAAQQAKDFQYLYSKIQRREFFPIHFLLPPDSLDLLFNSIKLACVRLFPSVMRSSFLTQKEFFLILCTSFSTFSSTELSKEADKCLI